MKNLKGKLVLVLAFCMIALVAKADVFDDIAVAIRSGNAKEISKYFDSSVELKTADKSSVYSKNQAELVLKEFLEKYPPKSFSIIHRGSSAKGARYAIGSMETSDGTFRTYLYIKDMGGKLFIQEMSFEKE